LKILFLSVFTLIVTPASLYASFLPASFSAKFEQVYVSTLKGKPKKGVGSIDYKYPGQIRFETSTPSTVIFVSNTQKSWYYRAPFIEGEKGEVTESSGSSGSATYIKFFDSLKNGLISNNYYDVKQGEPSQIIFKPKAVKELGIIESRLFFKSKVQQFQDLEKIELTFSDKKTSSMRLIDLKVNVEFAENLFNFVPPANTIKTN
jgi:outer membrane lipoprotein carrier protein